MSWDEMSSRERDALVAEHVMGTTEPDEDASDIYGAMWLLAARSGDDSKHPGWVVAHGQDPDDCRLIKTWWEPKPYTRHIAAAWEVVEKMREEGFHFAIESDVVDDEWEVEVHVDAPESDYGRERVCRPAYHASLPEAICVIALRAKGVWP